MPQDAVALVKADHQKVNKLFKEFEAAGDRAYKTKQRLVEQVTTEVEAHATIEEELSYPAVEELGGLIAARKQQLLSQGR